MVALRVLMLVEDSPPVVAAAASLAAAVTPSPQAPPAPSTRALNIPNIPMEVQLDAAFLPAPIHLNSAVQTLSAAGMSAAPVPPPTVGTGAYVVRGIVDAADLDAVTNSTMGPGGEVRIFADPAIGMSQTCGGTPPVGTATDVERLLQVGRLRRLGMQGEGVALAIVDTGINLAHLQARGMAPRMNFHASWTPQVTVQPGAAPVDHGTMCAFDALLLVPLHRGFDGLRWAAPILHRPLQTHLPNRS